MESVFILEWNSKLWSICDHIGGEVMKQILGIVLTITLSLASLGCSNEENITPSLINETQKVVEVMEITEEVFPRTLEYFGIVNAIGFKSYSFSQMGKITNIFVEEGQKVVKGDILAQLDTKDHDLALEEAVNNLTKAATSYEYLEEQHNKTQKQWEEGEISQQEYNLVKLEFELAEANLKNTLVEYENKLNLLEETQLCTDMDGYVLKVNFQPGEIVEKGMPVIIIRENRLIVEIEVPQGETQKIRGSGAHVNINGQHLLGKVIHIDPIPDKKSRTYKALIALSEEEGLMLGDIAKVTIVWGEDQGIAIPITCVMNEDDDYVFVVEEEKIVKRTIEIGRIVDNYILVTGLEAGELLVVEGLEYVSEGDKVELNKK